MSVFFFFFFLLPGFAVRCLRDAYIAMYKSAVCVCMQRRKCVLCINIHAPRVWLYSKEVRYADVLIISRMPSTYRRSVELLGPWLHSIRHNESQWKRKQQINITNYISIKWWMIASQSIEIRYNSGWPFWTCFDIVNLNPAVNKVNVLHRSR